MAANGKTRTVRDWFVGLSTPAKALFFVGLACVAALVVAAIVVGGSPQRGVSDTTAEAESGSAGSGTASSTVAADATSAASPHGDMGSSATSSAAAAAAGTAGSSGSATGKKSATSSGSSNSGGTSSAGSGTPEDDSGTEAPSGPPVLTPELRKKIAAELVAAEKRAETEAAAKYPVDPKKGGSLTNSTQYEDLRSSLIDTYTAVIIKKYGLTAEQTIDILILDVSASE